MKLSREKLKKIIKEELEEMAKEQNVLEEGAIESFLQYLQKVMAAKQNSPVTEADQQDPQVQQKVSDFKKKVGSIGMGFIKGAAALGLDMTLVVALAGFKYGVDPTAIPAIAMTMVGGGLVGALVGGERAGEQGGIGIASGMASNVASGVKDLARKLK